MENVLVALALITINVVSRMLPHIPNVAPIAASALFSSTILKKRYAVIIPLVSMIISDFFIGFHSVLPFVWGSFIISGFMGMWLSTHRKTPYILGTTVLSSLQFFIVTNFGVWITTNMYPHTLTGLINCYAMGLPFYRFTFLGDMAYTLVLFGALAIVLRLKKRFAFQA